MKRIIAIVGVVFSFVISLNAFAEDITVNNNFPATASTDPHSQGQENNNISAPGGKEDGSNAGINSARQGPELIKLSTAITRLMINPNILSMVGIITMKHDCSVSAEELADIFQEKFKDYVGDPAFVELRTTRPAPYVSVSFFGYHWSQDSKERCETSAIAYAKK